MARNSFHSLEIEQSMRALCKLCVDDANRLAEWLLKGERIGVPINQSEIKKQFRELEDILKSISLSQKKHDYIVQESENADAQRREIEQEITSHEDLSKFDEVEQNLANRLEAFSASKRRRPGEEIQADIKNALEAIKSAEGRVKRSRGSIELVSGCESLTIAKHNLICPLTKKQFVNRVLNQFCRHSYEKEAIENAIANSDRGILCPYNCNNKRAIQLSHLLPDEEKLAALNCSDLIEDAELTNSDDGSSD